LDGFLSQAWQLQALSSIVNSLYLTMEPAFLGDVTRKVSRGANVGLYHAAAWHRHGCRDDGRWKSRAIKPFLSLPIHCFACDIFIASQIKPSVEDGGLLDCALSVSYRKIY
jgi:hypothetical protein